MEEETKLFTDPFGKFQMFTPVGYQYKNPGMARKDWEPHAFGAYDKSIGAFQISCRPITGNIAHLIMKRQLKIQSASSNKLAYEETFNGDGDLQAHMWMAAVGDHFVLATYIYDIKIKATAEVILPEVRRCIDTIKFIKPEFRPIVLANRRYSLFMSSIGALIDLKNKAVESCSFIELVILTANKIDAILRLAIVLTIQLENNTNEIDTSLLFQGKEDKPISEGAIYKRALALNIINQALYDSLDVLYKERNKVVHRYIITDFRTEQVIDLVLKYYEIENELDIIIKKLEVEQFTKKV